MTKFYDNEKLQSMNDLIYRGLNNGVYRVGFAKSQEAFSAVDLLFKTLDELEKILNENLSSW